MALTFGQGMNVYGITGSHRISKFAEQLCNCQNFFASLELLHSFGSTSEQVWLSIHLLLRAFCELSASFALTIPEISEIPSTSFTVVPDRPQITSPSKASVADDISHCDGG